MNASSELLGHNAAGIRVNVEVKMFNSVSRHAGRDGAFRQLDVAAGSDIGDILKLLNIPLNDVFLVLVNGHDITPGKPPKLGAVRTTYVVEEGDAIALSGPVPYSWGYGAPIV